MSQAPPPPQWPPPGQPYGPPYGGYPQPHRDDEHLKLLWIFHYVLGGVVGLFSFMPLIYVTIGVYMVTGGMHSGRGPGHGQEVGWVFIVLGAVFILAGWTLAILLLTAAGQIKKRRNWNYCFAVACVSCLFAPMGTALGVFTILTLNRVTVRAAFGKRD